MHLYGLGLEPRPNGSQVQVVGRLAVMSQALVAVGEDEVGASPAPVWRAVRGSAGNGAQLSFRRIRSNHERSRWISVYVHMSLHLYIYLAYVFMLFIPYANQFL